MAQQIEQLLAAFPAEQRHVRFTFTPGEAGYLAEAMLTLPTGNLLARTPAPIADHRAAIDALAEELAAELRRHQRRVRHDEVEGRRRRRERDAAAAAPHLDTLRAGDDRAGFFDALRPLLRQLRSHARRELTIAQLEGSIPPGDLTVGDLLDEVIVRAWDGWPDRPRDQTLEKWLVGLLHDVLDARDSGRTVRAAAAQPVSLYERLRDSAHLEHGPAEDNPPAEINPAQPYAVENGWAVENNPYWPFVDSLTREDVLPDENSPEPLQTLMAEEQRRAILDELNRFPREARRAFALHVLEGWSVDEISRAQHRPRIRVDADIEAVRHALRRRLAPLVA